MFRKRKIFKIFIFLLLLTLGVIFYNHQNSRKTNSTENFNKRQKNINLIYENLMLPIRGVSSNNVQDFIKEKNIDLDDNDYIFPFRDSKIYDGSSIFIFKEKKSSIIVDGKKIEGKTFGDSVGMVLWDNNIKLGEDDFTIPAQENPLQDKSKIEVVRVDIKEETVKKEIDFERRVTENGKLSWRTKKVSQKGVKGIDEYIYRVVSHNGKEISRKLLSKERIKDPIPEISVQGTYMKLGKANKGQGTWYTWKGGMFAASTTIPRGSFAKVTNIENGKTVVVQINDYGPQGKGRIIDLDKVAFEKIASLGAGVIGVKVEQILN